VIGVMDSIVVDSFRPGDRAAVHALLTSHRLPTAGFDDRHVMALVARADGKVIGSAAIEVYGAEGLLRSVAVAAAYRGRTVGTRLTRAAVDLARQHRLSSLYLLTETAPAFFPKIGFVEVSRADVPANVQESIEFRGACCVSAKAFHLRLGAATEGER
jgi:amino-acid N-acetyltransferase